MKLMQSTLAIALALLFLVNSASIVSATSDNLPLADAPAESFTDNQQSSSSGPLLKIGKDVTIPAGTQHTGNIVAFGGHVTIDGQLNGNIMAIGGTVKVSGEVINNITVIGGLLFLHSGARVEGNVTAVGGGLEREDGVQLQGDVNNISLSRGLRVPRLSPFRPRSYPAYFFYLLSLYLSVLIISRFFPKQLLSVENSIQSRFWRSTSIGLMALILMLPISAGLIVAAAGLPLAFLYWLIMGWATVLGYAGVTRSLGRWLCCRCRLPGGQLWLTAFIGVLVLGILRAVPWLGPVTAFIVLICGLGAAIRTHLGSISA